MTRHPAFPYVAPFILFLAFLLVRSWLPAQTWWEYPLRVILVSVVLLIYSRHVIALKASKPLGSLSVGLLVFVIWIGPDLLWPGYRNHWLFRNSLTGAPATTLHPAVRSDPVFLFFRILGTVVVVPIIEELFWRGWLLRFLISGSFLDVPLGTYAVRSFWLTALLFASEHGPYWDVGLLAGILYNWWITRTSNLADCILAHAVTNGCLAIYVLAAHKWQYWL